MARITKSAERRHWLIVFWLMLLALIVGMLLFQKQRITGIPGWLKSLGILDWLKSLEPLDKWLTFIGATLIGLYAIFHETLWAWIRRPKLIITFDTVSPHCIPMPIRVQYTMVSPVDAHVPSFRIRFLVKNAGITRPVNVGVCAPGLREKQGQEFLPIETIVPSFQVRILI